MATSRLTRPTTSQPGWWAITGSETCHICAARFDYEVEVRCADCDAALCPMCALEVASRRTMSCLRCAHQVR